MRPEQQVLKLEHNGVSLKQTIANVEAAKGKWVKTEWAVIAFVGISLAADYFMPRYSWSTHAPTPIVLSGVFGPVALLLGIKSQMNQLDQRFLRLKLTTNQLTMGDHDLTNASKEHLDHVWQGLEVLAFMDKKLEQSAIDLKQDGVTFGQAVNEVRRSKARWENAKLVVGLVGAAYLTFVYSSFSLSEMPSVKLAKVFSPALFALAGHVFTKHKVEQLRTRVDNLDHVKVKIYYGLKGNKQAWLKAFNNLSPDKRSRIWQGLELSPNITIPVTGAPSGDQTKTEEK